MSFCHVVSWYADNVKRPEPKINTSGENGGKAKAEDTGSKRARDAGDKTAEPPAKKQDTKTVVAAEA